MSRSFEYSQDHSCRSLIGLGINGTRDIELEEEGGAGIYNINARTVVK
jgi:hypothetical protein